MGVGEEALGAHLASEGWSLKPGVLAHFGEREDLASARNALLDTDLRRVGEPIVRAGDAYLAGPVVLQVVAVRDISRPARDSRDPSGAASAFGNGRTKGSGAARTSSTKTKSSRMLRVELTDGDARLVAVEHEPLRFVKDEASVPPGSKVLVPKDVVVRKVNGVLLLRGDDEFVPLGGRVASLFRDWERARARSQSRKSDATRPPSGTNSSSPRSNRTPLTFLTTTSLGTRTFDPGGTEASSLTKRKGSCSTATSRASPSVNSTRSMRDDLVLVDDVLAAPLPFVRPFPNAEAAPEGSRESRAGRDMSLTATTCSTTGPARYASPARTMGSPTRRRSVSRSAFRADARSSRSPKCASTPGFSDHPSEARCAPSASSPTPMVESGAHRGLTARATTDQPRLSLVGFLRHHAQTQFRQISARSDEPRLARGQKLTYDGRAPQPTALHACRSGSAR